MRFFDYFDLGKLVMHAAGYDTGFVRDFYEQVLKKMGKANLEPLSSHHEFCTIAKDPDYFLSSLFDFFSTKRNYCQDKIDKITQNKNKSVCNRELKRWQESKAKIESIISQCIA
jgi:hypothetical protein